MPVEDQRVLIRVGGPWIAPDGSTVPHVAWITLLGPKLRSQLGESDALRVDVRDGVAWSRSAASTALDAPLTEVARALEPLLDHRPRPEVVAWFQGTTWGQEEASLWLRRWLLDDDAWANQRSSLLG